MRKTLAVVIIAFLAVCLLPACVAGTLYVRIRIDPAGSPVEIVITDPLSETSTLDTEAERVVVIPDAVEGLYLIRVIALSGADPGAHYTVEIGPDGVSYIIFGEGQLGETPPEGASVSCDYGSNAPVIVSLPDTTGIVGAPYCYGVDAVDVEGDPLVFRLTTHPAGMTIDPSTGLIEWSSPTPGEHDVVVEVDDGGGGLGTQRFTILVTAVGPAIPVFPAAGMAGAMWVLGVLAWRRRRRSSPGTTTASRSR